ncbi:hypothetical protein NA647_19230 [Pseudomonas stutzeri]|uniref:hypothetical protein n=1 Tax=Stutzerimonas stutzeri TaxID=316 RepID=UPI00210D5F04|nr:hypothetical protein [Stutzerimonas stutzeri]MCQ4289544.1 hypothetical protein [Stutzerimonas stutzeri]
MSVSSIAKTAVTVLKNSSPPKIIASAVIGTAIAAIPGAVVHEGELILKGEDQPYPPVSSTDYRWIIDPSDGTKKYSSPKDLCSVYGRSTETYIYPNGAAVTCRLIDDRGNHWSSVQGVRVGSTCPSGSAFSKTVGVCLGPGPSVPFTDANWDALEGAIPASDPSPDDVRDLWFDLCGGEGSCMAPYLGSPTLDGPASLPSTQTTTTSTGPAGTTTTTKTTQTDLDYSNPDGVISRDKTTTTTTNPDGSQSTDITEDTGPVVGAEPKDELEDGTFNDSPFPEVEPFYEQKYPDGLEGVWNTRSAEFQDSAFMDFLGSFVPSFSGSCPAWSMNMNIASWANFGIHHFQTLCWVFDFIKVVLLVSAAFLCRALMFGG